jgi:TRAP-type C4-dicarboxylate transport system permease small subunit
MVFGQADVWVRRGAEGVLALLLATMFVAFLTQIVLRYFFNLPTGWTSELTVVTWLWMVLWGAAFVLRDDEEIRLDLVYTAAPPRVRRVMMGLVAVALIGLYSLALPATFSYVSFMAVESTSYLKIRVDHLYSIFVIFLVAVILRQAWLLWRLFRDGDDGAGADVPAQGR